MLPPFGTRGFFKTEIKLDTVPFARCHARSVCNACKDPCFRGASSGATSSFFFLGALKGLRTDGLLRNQFRALAAAGGQEACLRRLGLAKQARRF